jgi:hypothetical protein
MSDEKTHDREKLKPLVKKAKKRVRVKEVLGDDSYGSRHNFDFLASEGIEPCIKVCGILF